ncbi:CRISPR-associated protein Cas4 [Fuchsiella alkaliacetigena]|uniref:CRISPR-associated protein Cas4 n=1 Tax=Fuchsiella alkaliacetigena TaxID=957042 RepID=UPI00200B61FA|nr:CRISPR-associated protein Cas4 [Fuchsiella alkaliacetigena]MCK8825706.1 CRISPR-associated protein Cas4 [Fuchsiella alkaliacetigena]
MLKIKVTDVKQFMYCQRIIYFTYCMPLSVKKTYKMDYGKDKHERVEELEKRRTLQRYGLEEGEKRCGIDLYSARLALRGKMDLLVVKEDEYIPIELKYSTRKPRLNHKYQLAAYGLLIEDQYQTSIRKGLIHLIPNKETFEVEMTSNLRKKVKEIINKIRELIELELMPEATQERGKCRGCEYRNFCGDV